MPRKSAILGQVRVANSDIIALTTLIVSARALGSDFVKEWAVYLVDTCLKLSLAAFIVFIVWTVSQLILSWRTSSPPKETDKNFAGVDPIKRLEASASLLAGITRAGPRLPALLASILFMTIASYTISSSSESKVGSAAIQTK